MFGQPVVIHAHEEPAKKRVRLWVDTFRFLHFVLMKAPSHSLQHAVRVLPAAKADTARQEVVVLGA